MLRLARHRPAPARLADPRAGARASCRRRPSTAGSGARDSNRCDGACIGWPVLRRPGSSACSRSCLAAGPEARASFRSAAALHGFDGFARGLGDHALRTPDRHRSPGSWSTNRTCSTPRHVVRVTDVPVTSVARTLCDLTAVVARRGVVERAVDEALRRKTVRLDDLVEIGRTTRRARTPSLHGHAGDPRAPPPGLRPGRERIRNGASPTCWSVPDCPKPTMQHPVEINGKRYRIDLCYPDAEIAIEFDSWQFHSRSTAVRRGPCARANDLVLLGFAVLRFTSKSSDQTIVDTVRAALQRASRS